MGEVECKEALNGRQCVLCACPAAPARRALIDGRSRRDAFGKRPSSTDIILKYNMKVTGGVKCTIT